MKEAEKEPDWKLKYRDRALERRQGASMTQSDYLEQLKEVISLPFAPSTIAPSNLSAISNNFSSTHSAAVKSSLKTTPSFLNVQNTSSSILKPFHESYASATATEIYKWIVDGHLSSSIQSNSIKNTWIKFHAGTNRVETVVRAGSVGKLERLVVDSQLHRGISMLILEKHVTAPTPPSTVHDASVADGEVHSLIQVDAAEEEEFVDLCHR